MEPLPSEDEDFPGRLLHQAALWDNAELLEDLLRGEEATYINSRDACGRTPLHAAAASEDSRCLKVLLEAGADANIACGPKGENRTPLHVASEHGHVNSVRCLVQYCGTQGLLARDACGLTPLDIAEKGDHTECMLILKEAADEKERRRQESHAALRNACAQGEPPSVIRGMVQALGEEAELIVNMAPNGSNTLLFTACEAGQKETVKVLLANEADGRIHPVTKYSPLYIACYYGRKDIVELLLKKFPELVQQQTVERWLPIHACCINGHGAVAEQLLRYPYPPQIMQKFYDPSGQWEYELPFDINHKDVTGQTVLYQACYLGNKKLVDLLLKYKVKAYRIKTEEKETTPVTEDAEEARTENGLDAVSPTRRRISDGIQSIMSKLNLSSGVVVDPWDGSEVSWRAGGRRGSNAKERMISPLHVNVHCNNGAETALHAAVRGGHHLIVSALLTVGNADPNLPIRADPGLQSSGGMDDAEDDNSQSSSRSRSGTTSGQGSASASRDGVSTALTEACSNRDIPMVELLLRHSARDDRCQALRVALANGDEGLVALLLATKAHRDPEYRVNPENGANSGARDSKSGSGGRSSGISFSTLTALGIQSNGSGSGQSPPSQTPVMINWHSQRDLTRLRTQWLADAAFSLNPSLRASRPQLGPPGKINSLRYLPALNTITRLDVSDNSLRSLPLIIFSLHSLRYLNVAQNKIEKLPCRQHPRIGEEDGLSKAGLTVDEGETHSMYTAPVLEEILLQNNRLEELPEEIFLLPALVSLDVSNNKLQVLPHALWQAPKLKELNVAFNLLRDLPLATPPILTSPTSVIDVDTCAVISAHSSMSSLVSVEEGATAGDSNSSSSEVPSQSSETSKGLLIQAGALHMATQKAKAVRHLELRHHTVWRRSVEVSEQVHCGFGSDDGEEGTPTGARVSQLSALNLAHNAFTRIPHALPCLAVNLTRLNLSYNNLRSMGHITSYPGSLKQLDLSHNQICCWPSLPQLVGGPLGSSHSVGLIGAEGVDPLASIACYAPMGSGQPAGPDGPPVPLLTSPTSDIPIVAGKIPAIIAGRRAGAVMAAGGSRSIRSAILNAVCIHRRHLRLDNLRTLILADNMLARIQLSTDDDGGSSGQNSTNPSPCHMALPSDEDETGNSDDPDLTLSPLLSGAKARLMFPNLSMLDISNNHLREIPLNIHELNNLSVLNLSGNPGICELPPQMGLLSRLWNLSTRGCSLQEPLRSMIDSKKYKTMDVVGYLKSVLEDARPYARMKLMIVGVQGIGKTSLLEQLRQEGSGAGTAGGAIGGGSGSGAGGPAFKKKQPEHWAKRMGNKNINVKTAKGTNISTVGVDICDWVYEKKIRGQSSYGAVVFRTWDFGGQREYYATHQYFLSKRSLYLVVWRIPDGQRGIAEILQWLVNIQARAPNSPVIIVGTHYDMMREHYPSSMSEDLQQMIRDKFINIVDAEKCGLPRVLDTIEVSCKTRHNIKLLCNLIYDTVFSLRPPGSKELLLEQRVPASYLALEEVVGHIAWERRMVGGDPVLTAEQYRAAVTREMLARHHRTFRDTSELNQATAFLHENGVLLHYDDATLKDLYFLDPQWLCDMLAHVVTIREINPFARTGVMKLDDLKHVFKSSSPSLCANARGYIVSLLNKFEVALTWDSRTLLIPSLLPSEEQIRSPHSNHLFVRVKIPVRTRGWTGRHKKMPVSSASTIVGNSSFYTPNEKFKMQKPVLKGSPGATKISAPSSGSLSESEDGGETEVSGKVVNGTGKCELTHRGEPELSIRRLLLMSYFPSGFWSRLTTRILADDAIVQVVRSYFILPKEVTQDPRLINLLDVRAEWILWQTGMELRYLDTTLFRMKEVLPTLKNSPVDYRQLRFRLKQEGVWSDVDLNNSSILEIYFPVDTVVIKRPIVDETVEGDEKESEEPIGYQAIVLDPSPECIAKLLALAVDHIDILLEDWYPTLGTRFVHTSEGRFLVTRLVPCPRCLSSLLPGDWASDGTDSLHSNGQLLSRPNHGSWSSSDGIRGDCYSPNMSHHLSDHVNADPALEGISGPNHHYGHMSRQRVRKSQESCTSDGDSGVGPDSAGSSRNPSVEGHPGLGREGEEEDVDEQGPVVAEEAEPEPRFGWMVEECILAAYDRPQALNCPTHGDLQLAQIAPDTVFLDLGDRYLIRPENIRRGALLGRGAFGFVFRGTCRLRGPNTWGDVAMKMLQPVQPGVTARPSALIAYKAAQGKWERDPLQYACKAYCTARQELNILLSLHHANIVPLVGVCTRPLALVLDLAPQGALDTTLRHYRRSGARLTPHVLQAIILQVAKAIEYLHQQHIIYRDLKSENVLVWHLPSPFQCDPATDRVHVKLADYGISRLTLPSGTKGFGGTEGFMAPEIMRYNGEEEYTEKVDCFSFGMFIYELLTLHQPFEGHESVKECILEGGRPPLTHRETQQPSYIMDLMALCWAQQPRDRPSASQLVSIASAPEFTHLYDVLPLESAGGPVLCACPAPPSALPMLHAIPSPHITQSQTGIPITGDEGVSYAELWLGRGAGRVDLLVASGEGRGLVQYCTLPSPPCSVPTAACPIGPCIWLGDANGHVHGVLASDCSTVFSYTLGSGCVRSIVELQGLGRVVVGMSDGSVFLVRSDSLPSSPTRGEGSFVIARLHSGASALHTLVAVGSDHTKECELWCGESKGNISIYTIRDGMVTSQETVNHCEPIIERLEVLHLVSASSPATDSESGEESSVWSYVYPGCVVYHWEAKTRTILNRLDCSKLVPCSESLKSISIEEHLSPGRCQVTSMAVIGSGELYIGTTWGCVVIAERRSMRPITVFRPYEEEVRVIVELNPWPSLQSIQSPASSNSSSSNQTPERCPLVATVGRGYRSLMARYTDFALPATPDDGAQDDRGDGSKRCSSYVLLWAAGEQWAPI
ncbi:leucine-rich repeat serine/threonine-protein kinase 1 [Ischnura elegans]|uniref:leucine-rich repeat serine/threonine-protein kinase 1 n=1 Tax=Ischnura elegans TaxID=197161 RepID=UPI001ED86779|nr:leucine-rich repeat serine/threonine-protein kinase 1 [Ischnura elegans]